MLEKYFKYDTIVSASEMCENVFIISYEIVQTYETNECMTVDNKILRVITAHNSKYSERQ